VTTIAFDIAALELFTPLIVGGRVIVAARDEVSDGYLLMQRLDSSAATALQATPATWRLLLEADFRSWPGFKMLCGGEALPRELAMRLLEGGGELWNMYGPTETTIWSSCTRVRADDALITVGKPIQNTQFYVLDRHDQPLPLGVPGQLHIGGDGVARGYHRKPELTADKFIADPFAVDQSPKLPGPAAHTEQRLYRTGDLARWRADGSLQVLGRIDHQVKLRGFRIELGEIESLLTSKGGLATSVVLLREDPSGAPRLVAYYVETANAARTPTELRAILARDLPEYMIPTAWVKLDALPVSPNGKLDRVALPAPDATPAGDDFVAPQTATETLLAQIWAEVLQQPRIGINSDIFSLGADSIHLFQITARVHRAGLPLSAKQLMQHRTIAELAALFEPSGQSVATPDAVAPESTIAATVAQTTSAAPLPPPEETPAELPPSEAAPQPSATPRRPSLLEFKKSRFSGR